MNVLSAPDQMGPKHPMDMSQPWCQLPTTLLRKWCNSNQVPRSTSRSALPSSKVLTWSDLWSWEINLPQTEDKYFHMICFFCLLLANPPTSICFFNWRFYHACGPWPQKKNKLAAKKITHMSWQTQSTHHPKNICISTNNTWWYQSSLSKVAPP